MKVDELTQEGDLLPQLNPFVVVIASVKLIKDIDDPLLDRLYP